MRRRLLVGLAASSLLAVSALPAHAAPIGPRPPVTYGVPALTSGVYRVAVGTVAVRSSPGSGGAVVGTVRSGYKVEVIGRQGAWSKVAYNRWVLTSQTRATTPPSFARGAVTATYAGLPVEAGTHITWYRHASLVVLVRNGTVVRAMPTTDNDWATVPGNYSVRAMPRTGSSGSFRLPYFTLIGTIPGRTGIGFHSVPVTAGGRYIQPLSTVGKPGYESHGCLRLRPADAKALAAFVRVGLPVKVR